VVEGEKLIKFGSHDAAVTMIAAGLEEAFSKHLRQQKKGRRTLGQLSRMVDDLSLHAGTRQVVTKIMQLRNVAVHGKSGERVTEKDARWVLRQAKTLIREMEEQGAPNNRMEGER